MKRKPKEFLSANRRANPQLYHKRLCCICGRAFSPRQSNQKRCSACFKANIPAHANK